MKAVVWHGVGDIRLETVPNPTIAEPTDAIVRLTASAICGTDLHLVRGTFTGMVPGTILGHEGVGIVEQIGPHVRNLAPGDRVVIGSTIACGSCAYCREGWFAQCDRANPNGPQAGTAFYGGPKETGPFDGMQAEFVRVPFAQINSVRIPPNVTDDQAIMISDIFTTGYFGADLAHIHDGATVVVFGCGPVGQFAIASAFLLGAGRVLAVDRHPDRLKMAAQQGAEAIDFSREDPVETIRALTGGIGADRAIDAVGIDAESAGAPPDQPGRWRPGNAPSQVLQWAVQGLAKGGTLSVIGVYPPTFTEFPIGMAMNKNVSLRMGNCNHRKYIPKLLAMVAAGTFDPQRILTEREPVQSAIDAYEAFDQRRPGWIKVELLPQAGTDSKRPSLRGEKRLGEPSGVAAS